jgi:hypothetical protein
MNLDFGFVIWGSVRIRDRVFVAFAADNLRNAAPPEDIRKAELLLEGKRPSRVFSEDSSVDTI